MLNTNKDSISKHTIRRLISLFAFTTILYGCAALKPPPPAMIMLPAEKSVPESKYIALTSLEMGTKSVYRFVPNIEPKNYGIFIKFQNVSKKPININALFTPPLSVLETCNLETKILPNNEGGLICMQSYPASGEDYTLTIKVIGESKEMLEELTYTIQFSENDVSAVTKAVGKN